MSESKPDTTHRVRGGDEYPVRRAFATPKARALYREFSPTGEIEDSFEFLTTVRALSDDSVYFISNYGALRIVFCVAHGYTLADGQFAAVGVQRRWADGKRERRRMN